MCTCPRSEWQQKSDKSKLTLCHRIVVLRQLLYNRIVNRRMNAAGVLENQKTNTRNSLMY